MHGMPHEDGLDRLQGVAQVPLLRQTLPAAQQVPWQQVWPEGQGQVSLQAGRDGQVETHWPF
jgi:hypothetical protein